MKPSNNKVSFGVLYLIPVLLGDSEVNDVLPAKTIEITSRLKNFISENAKSARYFLKKLNLANPLQEIAITEIDKHNDQIDFNFHFEALRRGEDTGLLSEAGMPAVADPGSKFVLRAHNEGIKVVPLSGPSSILLSLAASGLNGQSFVFHGYLSKDKEQRKEQIRLLEKNAKSLKQTQIFIETPYRNQVLLDDIIQTCSGSTQLCVASEVSLSTEQILTKTISDWKTIAIDLNKKPTVFLIL
ncbi:MAG: SAM-dependent methyltransferase [Bacteroidetes bacterium]|nr:SAM-dependent methyltransferase [Bacteroidota bacterium]